MFTSTEYVNLNTTDTQFVTDLYEGFLQRAPDTPGLNNWVSQVPVNGRNNVRLAFAVSPEFAENVSAMCPGTSAGTSTSANLKYVLTDLQGSGRALMNNTGSGTSTIVSRHDYLPFGEEISAGIGLRTTTQKYSTTDKVRQKFALTERDEATGLDHTWFRKYESYAGRWTSPDPYAGGIGNPQSFNRYSYVNNDPTNQVDPSGLLPCTFDAAGNWCIAPDPEPIGTTQQDRILAMLEMTNPTMLPVVDGGALGGLLGNLQGRPVAEPHREHPHRNEGNLHFDTCAEFVEFLVNEAVAAFYNQPFNRHSKANILGVHMMDLACNGYDRHINNGATGFKTELTGPGGQGAGVYGHVLGQGGAMLGGLATLAVGGLADAIDPAQRVWGTEQSPAEMAGNRAGWAVGNHIYNFLTGKTPSEPDRLRNSLTAELCQ